MNENFDLQNYLIEGVEGVVKEAIKATLKNPRESAFMLKFAKATRTASKKRREAEDKGEHIPPFLIASITSKCNLHCAGCYSRCNHATTDTKPVSQLTSEEWLKIFDEQTSWGSALSCLRAVSRCSGVILSKRQEKNRISCSPYSQTARLLTKNILPSLTSAAILYRS